MTSSKVADKAETGSAAPTRGPRADRTALRRGAQLEALIDATEARIQADGVRSLKMRDLAADIGVALGGIYNIVADMDDLLLRVTDRSLRRLDRVLAEAAQAGNASSDQDGAVAVLEATAIAYLGFARDNLSLWRAMFEMPLSKPELPEYNIRAQLGLFEHIAPAIKTLLPDADDATRVLTGRTLFGAVHGIVLFGLEDRLIAVPRVALEAQLKWLVRSVFTTGV